MTRAKDAVTGLYFCYWSLRDPLCQSQSLAYLRLLAAEGRRFMLITFEQPPYALDAAGRAAAQRELLDQGIRWYPLRYHKGWSLLGKAWDWLQGVATGIYLMIRYRPQVVHSRATIPAAMALVVARLCRTPFLYDADSSLPEEYADIGHWRRGGLAFRLASAVERLARRWADVAIVLTESMRERFVKTGMSAPVTVIPCCVDVTRFRFDPAARAARRQELGLHDERFFIYVGKVGSWYLVDETFEFFRVAAQVIGSSHLLILTPDAPAAFHALAAKHGVERSCYTVKSATHDEVIGWLSAADVGLALITRLPSKHASSPVKAGEYLAAGLPVVITNDIGDYSGLVDRERVGVVLEQDTPQRYRAAATELQALWQEGASLRDRCRAVAEAHVGLTEVGLVRYRRIYDTLTSCDGCS
jgi:glycosyltransferase involved in cell wall biosynthesis